MPSRRSSLSLNQRLTLMLAALTIFAGIIVAFISGHDWFPLKSPKPAIVQTESPSFQLTGCGIPTECANVKRLQEFFPNGTDFKDPSVVHRVTIESSQPFRLNMIWCALTQALLEDNLKQIQFVLNVNGISYADKYKLQYSSQTFEETGDQPWYCYGGGVVFSDLQPGEYHIVYGLKHGTIFDGETTYPASENVNPSFDVTIK